jgi:hypothetical protein
MRHTKRRISRCLTLIAVHTCEWPQTPHAAVEKVTRYWRTTNAPAFAACITVHRELFYR